MGIMASVLQSVSCMSMGNPGVGKPCRNAIPEDSFLGHGPMFKFVRRWSNLIQISAFVKAGSMDLPKTMRIFVH